MGAGGRTSIPPPTKKSDNDHKKRVPVEKPPFSLSQLKKAIPPHCFKRSIIRSFSYVVYDLTIAFIFYYIATHYFQYLPRPLSFLAWPTYWFVQGCILTGVWVIAHECGHHAFSDYQWIDDTIGFILHSALLTPYFSWKYSHRRHHSNTGSLEWDEVYVPKQKSNIYWYYKYINNNPLGRALIIIITLTLGFPLYLAMNVSGRPYDKFPCHFNPHGPIYSDRERLQVYISNVGLLVVFYGLYLLTMSKGFAWVVCVYGVPLLVVNGFFVLITYVHHTHLALPRFDSSEWEWMRGALLTMDRDFGILNKIFHDVTNTHVAHHLFSTIPHYHAMEATKALKPILGEYYRCDDIPFYKAIWREAGECIYIEPDQNTERKGVFWYNNKW